LAKNSLTEISRWPAAIDWAVARRRSFLTGSAAPLPWPFEPAGMALIAFGLAMTVKPGVPRVLFMGRPDFADYSVFSGGVPHGFSGFSGTLRCFFLRRTQRFTPKTGPGRDWL